MVDVNNESLAGKKKVQKGLRGAIQAVRRARLAAGFAFSPLIGGTLYDGKFQRIKTQNISFDFPKIRVSVLTSPDLVPGGCFFLCSFG